MTTKQFAIAAALTVGLGALGAGMVKVGSKPEIVADGGPTCAPAGSRHDNGCPGTMPFCCASGACGVGPTDCD